MIASYEAKIMTKSHKQHGTHRTVNHLQGNRQNINESRSDFLTDFN